MRVKLSDQAKQILFRSLKERQISLESLSFEIGISSRSLRTWRNGPSSIPEAAYKKIAALAEIDEMRLRPKLVEDFWHVRSAAKKGGIARIKIHGSPGTIEGRRKGGLASLKIHNEKQTGFHLAIPIVKPKRSAELAELLGILLGDGHLSRYQVLMTTNSKTDIEHAEFVRKQFEKIFGLKASLKKKKAENAVTVVISSVKAVQFLNAMGMPIGNKLKKGLRMPNWVKVNKKMQRAFLRGLFDTDGCVYLDRHKVGTRLYFHMGWTITSYAGTLLEDIFAALVNLGFSPTWRSTQKSVYLRRQAEIKKYFETIGSHNSKHVGRYKKFIGEVA